MVFFKIIKEGAHIGPEPMTNRFVVVMSGTDERSVPGNTIAVQADMPFSGLTTFGTAFLSKFECSQMPHLVLLAGVYKELRQAWRMPKSKLYRCPKIPRYHLKMSLQLNVSFRIGANGLENSLGKKVCGMHTSLENLFCFRTWIQLTLQQKWRI
ncbi:uncharacterized protein LOC128034135 isoform X3 [Gossypium raimondii]|uniref:uncharacterized protein LOC128034135 isoform X3 n=1 Tax=Gossypium raimondii TaxID=29730 RepID=UPI00227B773C|nr:uncharacterized protein LOC128034135 isoform X3 [Gossypium raimondii]